MRHLSFSGNWLAVTLLLSGLCVAAPPIELTALQCFDNLMVNHAIASSDCSIFGSAEIVDNIKNAEGTLGIEWFEAKHAYEGQQVKYSESRYAYSMLETNATWERFLINGRDRYLGKGPIDRPMSLVACNEDPKTGKLEYKLRPTMRGPNAFALTVLPMTSFVVGTDSDDSFAAFLDKSIDLYSESVDGDIVTGVFVSKRYYFKMEFDKSQGHMPTKVKGFFAHHKGQLEAGLSEKELCKDHAFTISTKWKRYGEGRMVYLPVEIVNTVHKFNSNVRDGSEAQLFLSWKIVALEQKDFAPKALNDGESTSKLKVLRDELITAAASGKRNP